MQTLQCQNSLPNRKLQAPLKNFQTSDAPAKSESNMAVSSPAGPKLTGRGSLIAMELKQERENHEESASKHCIRMCGDVCVGTGFGTTTTTTTTEGNGTITEYTPGSAIVLKQTSGPVRYRFGKTVT